MRGFSGFIILAIIALKIIASIVQSLRKEQEKNRAADAARQRAADAASGHAVPVSQQPPTARGVAAPDADLDARRRAQLEQLRQRREGRRVGMPKGGSAGVMVVAPTQFPSARTGVPPVQQVPQRPRGVSYSVESIGSSDQARTQAQQAERRARDQERQRREQQARLEAERGASRKAAEQQRAARESLQAQRAAQTAAAAAAAGGPGSQGDRAAIAALGLSRQLRDPASLRQMVVLREILDQPLGLRGPAA